MTVTRVTRLTQELSDIELYLNAFRDQAKESLAAVRSASQAGPAPDQAGASQDLLAKQVAALQQENRALRARAASDTASPSSSSPIAARAQDSASAADLAARCAALEQQLAEARRSGAPASTSASASDAARQRGAGGATDQALAAPRGFVPATALHGLREQLSQLRADKEFLEDSVATMYMELFSEDTVKGLVSVLRKKENEFLAAASGGGSGAGKKGGPGKGAAPRLKQRLDESVAKIEKLEKELQMKDQEIDAVERHQADLMKIYKLESEAQLNHYKESWKAEQAKRKALHQKVLELKGAIRVFCRVRPLNKHDKEAAACISIKDQENLVISFSHGDAEARAGKGNRPASAPQGSLTSTVRERGERTIRDLPYEFDRVFGPADQQDAVYEDVSDLITSVADGYNVCIMAYGQTGSGKTYTMQGISEAPGINKRALQELFSIAAERKGTHDTAVQASIIEIYNENIYDLLSDSPRETSAKLEIKEAGGHIWIPNLVMTKVGSAAAVQELIQRGDTGRSTFATDMNEHSSRSHLILSLYVRVDNKLTGEKTASKLHLIDLAGSERLSRSNAQGERRREAQNINTSLSALGEVIQSLKSNEKHIPYRNCKLTRFLSDSLGGQSKTLFVVTLSPTRESAMESRCSCEFAMRAKKVELGRASRQLSNDTNGHATTTIQPRGASIGATASSRGRSRGPADPSKLRSGPA